MLPDEYPAVDLHHRSAKCFSNYSGRARVGFGLSVGRHKHSLWESEEICISGRELMAVVGVEYRGG